MISEVHVKALQRAATVLGGKEPLRARLRVPMKELEDWLDGAQAVPLRVFLQAVDLVSNPPPLGSVVGQSRTLRGRVAAMQAHAQATRRRSQELIDSLISNRDAEALSVAQSHVDVAVASTNAHMGNLQVVASDGLHIVVHSGGSEEFLDFFRHVGPGRECACATALRKGERFVVENIAASPVFAGCADVMERAGARAVQSTPLLGQLGTVVGVLSTHYAQAGPLPSQSLQLIDAIARRAAYWLDGQAA